MELSSLLAVARGDVPADLVVRNARLVNVFTGEIEDTDIAISAGKIVGLGPGYEGKEILDVAGAYVAPGLIDAHVHIESSLCVPAEFARAVVPRGITTVVTDPHEIANVAGVAGIQFMYAASRSLPLNVILMAPSCVPATRMGTSGATLEAGELTPLLSGRSPVVHGLAEVMNFPGVIHGDPAVHAKITGFRGRPIDGHAPGVLGKPLNAYVIAGIGSDHECVSVDEAREKISRGLYLLIREATNAHNLQALLPLITPANSRRICFCTDDRQPADLLAQGSIDYMVREAIAYGISAMDAIRMATLNTAEWFGLSDRGAIAPGKVADFFVFDDLKRPEAKLVYVAGKQVAADYAMSAIAPLASSRKNQTIGSHVKIDIDAISLRIPATGNRIRVIGSLPNQLVTEHQIVTPTIENGAVVSDPQRDILKMAVLERHNGTGNIGLGFIHGIGLQRGAIAGTVAHDHHNLVVIGVDDDSMLAAINAVQSMGGGLAAADGDEVLATLTLPVAGLMSDQPIEKVRDAYRDLLRATIDLGSILYDPFMAMSFMALEVIPKLKLTDQGLVDVERFERVDLFVS